MINAELNNTIDGMRSAEFRKGKDDLGTNVPYQLETSKINMTDLLSHHHIKVQRP